MPILLLVGISTLPVVEECKTANPKSAIQHEPTTEYGYIDRTIRKMKTYFCARQVENYLAHTEEFTRDFPATIPLPYDAICIKLKVVILPYLGITVPDPNCL